MDYSIMTKEQLRAELEKEVELWENFMREGYQMRKLAQDSAARIAEINHYYRLARESSN